jgi:hypothetical protein
MAKICFKRPEAACNTDSKRHGMEKIFGKTGKAVRLSRVLQITDTYVFKGKLAYFRREY